MMPLEGIEVVADAAHAGEVSRQIKESGPDVVLLDIQMRGMNVEVIEECKRVAPNVRIIVFSARDTEEHANAVLRAGADGYLAKDATQVELKVAIETVARGEQYGLEEKSGELPASAEPPALTARQLEILTLIAEGYSTKSIAHALNISVKTVESHRAKLSERLNIHDVAGLVRYAIRMGLVKIE